MKRWPFSIACLISLASAASVSAQESAVVRQLDDIVADARREGWDIGVRRLGTLNDGEAASFTTGVSYRGAYLVAGVCDNDCTDVDLAIEASWVIGSDNGPSDTPVIEVELYPNINYTVTVTMSNCTVEPCNWGVQLVYRNR